VKGNACRSPFGRLSLYVMCCTYEEQDRRVKFSFTGRGVDACVNVYGCQEENSSFSGRLFLSPLGTVSLGRLRAVELV